MDSEVKLDELSSSDQDPNQIDSKCITQSFKAKLDTFRLQYLEQPIKPNELDHLEQSYTRNEYNCQRRHHHNPKTMTKIQTLLKGEIKPKILEDLF